MSLVQRIKEAFLASKGNTAQKTYQQMDKNIQNLSAQNIRKNYVNLSILLEDLPEHLKQEAATYHSQLEEAYKNYF